MYALTLLTLGASAVYAAGVTSLLTPTASAPAGCQTDFPGVFQVTVVDIATGGSIGKVSRHLRFCRYLLTDVVSSSAPNI